MKYPGLIFLKDDEDANDEVRENCCDYLMMTLDHNQITCEKYWLLKSFKSRVDFFSEGSEDCMFYKRDGYCCMEISCEEERRWAITD
jgi:hypothetical protein